MLKKDNLSSLIEEQVIIEQKYPFDSKSYLQILSQHYHIPQLASFSCSPTTCIPDSKTINQHLARLVEKDRNKKNTICRDFAQVFVKFYKKQPPKSRKLIKSVLEKKGEAITILWTFMPYVFDKLVNKYALKIDAAINLIFRWIEITWYFNKIKSQKESNNLEIVPFSRIKMGYYLADDSQDVTHSFTQSEANYLAEKIIDQLG